MKIKWFFKRNYYLLIRKEGVFKLRINHRLTEGDVIKFPQFEEAVYIGNDTFIIKHCYDN